MRLAITCLLLSAGVAVADPAEITNVRASQHGDTWRFDVEILHPDTGWDHYADGWKVYAPDGTLLGERPLAHPHENEQPFTRTVSGIKVPDGVDHVMIHSNCSVDGETAKPYRVKLR
ncbi:hypothetical protein ACFE33_13625 [Falsihalocynthiibacter sp. SS001]|uniref:hypothetical protein n=1 Tax=Falsihalocynthiibacter sp. SS001 TaxID=3349698 RepID=UPI0036D400C0